MRNRKQSGEGGRGEGWGERESESGLTNDDDGNLDGLGEDEMMRAKPERKDAFVRPLAMRRRFAEEDLLDMSWRAGYTREARQTPIRLRAKNLTPISGFTIIDERTLCARGGVGDHHFGRRQRKYVRGGRKERQAHGDWSDCEPSERALI